MKKLFVVLIVVVAGLSGSAFAKGPLPVWVSTHKYPEPIAGVRCSKYTGLCYVDAWFINVYFCQISMMFESSLKRIIDIRQDWFDFSKSTFNVPVVVCRGKTGCSKSVEKLMCLDTENRLVYEIEDVSMFFEKPEPKRYEDYKR